MANVDCHPNHCHFYVADEQKFCHEQIDRENGDIKINNHFCDVHKTERLCFIQTCKRFSKTKCKKAQLVLELQDYNRKFNRSNNVDFYITAVQDIRECSACDGEVVVNPTMSIRSSPLLSAVSSSQPRFPADVSDSEDSEDTDVSDSKDSEDRTHYEGSHNSFAAIPSQPQNQVTEEQLKIQRLEEADAVSKVFIKELTAEQIDLEKRLIRTKAQRDLLDDQLQRVREINQEGYAAFEEVKETNEEGYAALDQSRAREQQLLLHQQQLFQQQQQLRLQVQEANAREQQSRLQVQEANAREQQLRLQVQEAEKETEEMYKKFQALSTKTNNSDQIVRRSKDNDQAIPESQDAPQSVKSKLIAQEVEQKTLRKKAVEQLGPKRQQFLRNFFIWIFSDEPGADVFRKKNRSILNVYNSLKEAVDILWSNPGSTVYGAVTLSPDDKQTYMSRSEQNVQQAKRKYLNNFVWWLFTNDKQEDKDAINTIRKTLNIDITYEHIKSVAFDRLNNFDKEFQAHIENVRTRRLLVPDVRQFLNGHEFKTSQSEELTSEEKGMYLVTTWMEDGNYLTPTMKSKIISVSGTKRGADKNKRPKKKVRPNPNPRTFNI